MMKNLDKERRERKRRKSKHDINRKKGGKNSIKKRKSE